MAQRKKKTPLRMKAQLLTVAEWQRQGPRSARKAGYQRWELTWNGYRLSVYLRSGPVGYLAGLPAPRVVFVAWSWDLDRDPLRRSLIACGFTMSRADAMKEAEKALLTRLTDLEKMALMG